jgi:hypothetical protein
MGIISGESHDITMTANCGKKKQLCDKSLLRSQMMTFRIFFADLTYVFLFLIKFTQKNDFYIFCFVLSILR